MSRKDELDIELGNEEQHAIQWRRILAANEEVASDLRRKGMPLNDYLADRLVNARSNLALCERRCTLIREKIRRGNP